MFEIDSMLVRAVGAALFHSLWQGAAIAAALWLYLRSEKAIGATSRYAASGFALVLMLIVPIFTVIVEVPAHDSLEVVALGDRVPSPRLDVSASSFDPVETVAKSAAPYGVAGTRAWLVSIWFTAVVLLLFRLLGDDPVRSAETHPRRAICRDSLHRRFGAAG